MIFTAVLDHLLVFLCPLNSQLTDLAFQFEDDTNRRDSAVGPQKLCVSSVYIYFLPSQVGNVETKVLRAGFFLIFE